MTTSPVPTLHAAFSELDRAIGLASSTLERDGRRENPVHLRSAFDDVRAALARTLPSQAAAARAADLLSTMPQRGARPTPADVWPGWIEEVASLLREVAAGRLAAAVAVDEHAKRADAEVIASCGDDAQKWAAAFMQAMPKVVGGIQVSEGTMIGWFANAIEEAWTVRAARMADAKAPVAADLVARKKLNDTFRGLVRAAEFREQEGSGSVWDDEIRIALAHARELGWGKNQIGRFDGAIGVDVEARRRIAKLQAGLEQDVVRYHRLRILGVPKPYGGEQTLLRFTNLDEWIDEDIRRQPSRGEEIDLTRPSLTIPHPNGLVEIERRLLGLAENMKHKSGVVYRELHRIHSAVYSALSAAGDIQHELNRVDRSLGVGADGGPLDRIQKFIGKLIGPPASIAGARESVQRDASADRAPGAGIVFDDSPIAAAESHLENVRSGNRNLGELIAKAYPDVPTGDIEPDLRPRAELLYDATDHDPARIPELTTVLQENIAAADDAMNRAIMALRTEVPESIANEILTRYQTVYKAFVRRQSQPSHELVSLRFFHEHVLAAARALRSEEFTEAAVQSFLRAITEKNGLRMMQPAPEVISVTVRTGAAADTRTFVEDGGLPHATEAVHQCRFIDDHGNRCTLVLDHEGKSTERGVHVFGTPFYERFDAPVIEAARRLVSRGIVRNGELQRGKEGLLQYDIEALQKLTDVVGELEAAMNRGEHG